MSRNDGEMPEPEEEGADEHDDGGGLKDGRRLSSQDAAIICVEKEVCKQWNGLILIASCFMARCYKGIKR